MIADEQSRIPRLIARLLAVRFFAALTLVVAVAVLDQVIIRLVLVREAGEAVVAERLARQRVLAWRLAAEVGAVEGIALAADLAAWQRGQAELPMAVAQGAAAVPFGRLAAVAEVAVAEGGGPAQVVAALAEAHRYDGILAEAVAELAAARGEREAALRWLQAGLFATLMLALGFVDLFVFRPSLRRIREVLEDLERVKRWAVEQEVAEASGRLERRIGQDLHDGVGQRLTGVAMMAKALSRRLAGRPEAADAGAIVAEINEAVAETRALSRQLFPSAAEAEGLGPALRDLASSTARLAALECTCDWDDDLPLPAVPADETTPAPMHLYRIAQEAVSNAVRHGRAARIRISGRREGDAGVLEVADDGIGLAASRAAVPSMGLGLRTMSYRAARLGGVIEVRDDSEGGAVVCLRWPLAPSRGEVSVLP